MLFPYADVLIDNSGLIAGMIELSRRVIFRVVPLEEVMLVFPGVDQEKLVILLQRACLNVRLEAKRAIVPVIPGINDGLHDLVVQSGLEDRLLVGDVQQHELPVVVRQSVFQNDGTLMTMEHTRRYQILTVACGPTNSIRGASSVLKPEHFGCANAIGSAISKVSGTYEKLVDYDETPRDQALENAKAAAVDAAVEAGAVRDTVEIIEMEDVPLAYYPGHTSRVKVKAAGDLR